MDKGNRTRVDAIERLRDARTEQERCVEQHDAARGSTNELAAQVDLQTADEQFAAREAWAKWTERRY